jgi:hypothetical protein
VRLYLLFSSKVPRRAGFDSVTIYQLEVIVVWKSGAARDNLLSKDTA